MYRTGSCSKSKYVQYVQYDRNFRDTCLVIFAQDRALNIVTILFISAVIFLEGLSLSRSSLSIYNAIPWCRDKAIKMIKNFQDNALVTGELFCTKEVWFFSLQYKLVSQIINFIYNISNISNYNFNKKNFILVISELGNNALFITITSYNYIF